MRSATPVRLLAAAGWLAVASLGSTARAQLLSEGPLSPGAVVNDASIGVSAWTNPGNAAADDGAVAVTSPGGFPTQYLKATGFGFAIPAPAQIRGIEVAVERRCNLSTVSDYQARIVKGGVIGSTDAALPGTWPTTDTVATYGSDSDLWGETWTPADVNDPGFGFALSVEDNADTAAVDYIAITVHYSLCGNVPSGGCRLAMKSTFLVKDVADPTGNKLVWKWVLGQSTSQAEFSDPLTTASYALCIYDNGGSNFVADTLVPPGTGWAALSTKGYKYFDSLALADGVLKMVLKASVDDKAKALVKGKGVALPPIHPPLTFPVVVQLVNSDTGVCWEQTYTTANILKNVTGLLKAKVVPAP